MPAGPFLSPDAEWLGFFVDAQLKKMPVNGGPPVTLAQEASFLGGADWGDDDWIVFGTEGGLARVASSGGPVEPLTNLESDTPGSRHASPQILPGSKTVLFTVQRGRGETRVEAVNVSTRARSIVLEDASDARYIASGQLIFQRLGSGSLFAASFDPDRLETDGAASPVLENVRMVGTTTNYTIGNDGTLVYMTAASSGRRELVWVDRSGRQELVSGADRYYQVRISPDGARIAMHIDDENGNSDIWVQDLFRNTLSRLTFEGENFRPEWTPDGEWILFSSNRTGKGFGIFRKRFDGSGEAEALLVLEDGGYSAPNTVSPDRRILGFTHHVGSGNFGTFDLEVQGVPELFLDSNVDQSHPAFSPDGRFVTYASDVSGRHEIYVQPFPSLDGRWQISAGGGQSPLWAHDGRGIFYRDGHKMMAVDIESAESFVAGQPRLLFENEDLAADNRNLRHFDVAADGRFLMLTRLEDESDRMHVRFELRRRAEAIDPDELVDELSGLPRGSGHNPILDSELRYSAEMPDIASDEGQIPSERDGRYP